MTYTVMVVNGGPADATGITVTDTLPADATFVSASASQGSCARSGKGKKGGLITCSLGAIAAGSPASVTIVVEPSRAGTLTNTATVRASQPDPNRTNNTDTEVTTVF